MSDEPLVIGFDYSMNAPAMSIHDRSRNKFVIVFASKIKKYHGMFEAVKPDLCIGCVPIPKETESEQERYAATANSFLDFLHQWDEELSRLKDADWRIEGYAMGAKGKVFHIAENTQCLKQKIWDRWGKELTTIAPTELKKFATGKGNADKNAMADAFEKHHGFHVHDILGCKKGSSPAADCVDAYFVSIHKTLLA